MNEARDFTPPDSFEIEATDQHSPQAETGTAAPTSRTLTSLIAIPGRLRRLLDHVPAIRPRRAGPSGNTRREATLLARSFHHPQGTGVIGSGADGLLRTVLVEALTSGAAPARVIVTEFDLDRLFPAKLDSALVEALAPRLHVTEVLEEAIEHLESEIGDPTPGPTIWLATPGADADVVHQTIQRRPCTDLIALFAGPWPYGPTHHIDGDGLHPSHQPIAFLSPEQAITQVERAESVRCGRCLGGVGDSPG